MTWWWQWPLVALCVGMAVVVCLSLYGAAQWAANTRALCRQLDAARTATSEASPAPTHFDVRELQGLPAPVQRYFRTVLTPGQALIAAATIHLRGRFNLSSTGQKWKPFTSEQHVRTLRPGFLWNANIQMLPGLPVCVVDSYIAGQGLLHAAVLGLFNVAQAQSLGADELARGEFMRWFAEAPWYPTALLPSQGVRWQAVDDSSANATLVDGPLTVTLLLRFNAAGLIASFRAEARGAGVGPKMRMLPWEGRWSDYRVTDGMTLPFTGEVAWMQPEGRRAYFVGSVTELTTTS
jgi:hypothetical protein